MGSLRKTGRATIALTFALIATGGLTAPAVAQEVENVRNGDFSAGANEWFTTSNLSSSVVDGRLCVEVPGGTTRGTRSSGRTTSRCRTV